MITAIVSRNYGEDSYVVQVVRNDVLYKLVTNRLEILPWGLGKSLLRFDDKKVFLIDKLFMA